MNLTALIASTRYRLGIPTTDALHTDAILTDLINAGLHYIETEHPWPWLEKEATITTASGTASYALPSDYRSTIAVVDPSGFELEQAEATEIRLLLAASGAPKYFDRFGTNIRLAPTPSGIQALTHIYVAVEPDLAGTATPLMTSVYHNAIVEQAAYMAFRRAGRVADAGAAKAAYDDWLAQMKVEAVSYSDDEGGGKKAPPEQAVKR